MGRRAAAVPEKFRMNMVTFTTWTEARVADLKAFILEGYSSSQIAFKLGDCTRNAVIGKVNRLKLSRVGIMKKEAPRAPRQLPPKSQSRQRYTPESKRFTTVFDNVQKLNLRCATIAPTIWICSNDLEPHHCRWPYGQENYVFCGHDKRDGSSYCRAHFTLSKRLMS
jgi:GcrA cell cycle regulator